ncbi:hypothetical protein E2562_006648 [Oryza meyeriana var. granulata]|uniref:Reverse transcriptase Ty1/copia-type domain-containing protein n=1 Tax=Oryza meyeriana var. granulata TaxID=110450 RepID=A0A6G1EFS6_9ORYZ|nr:hypothetical protein E2562_006648 [Oryza meyeriana var. granulata]
MVVSRDVVFDEAAQWDWSVEDGGGQVDDEPFTVEYTTEYVSGAPQAAAWMPAPVAPSFAPAGSPMPATPPAAPTPATLLPYEPINFVTPPADLGEDLDVDHDDDAPLQFCTIDAIIGPASPPGLAPRVLDKDLMFTTVDEPASFGEAERKACWRQAMREEMCSIEDNSTWELIALPTGHQAPRAWNAKLDASLVSLGFQRSSLEHGIYMRNKGASQLIHGKAD